MFSRASVKRFNEVQGCAPPVGHYDPKGLKSGSGPGFDKTSRFTQSKEFGPSPADFDISSCSVVSGSTSMLGPPAGVYSSTPRKKSLSSASSMESLKEKKKSAEETYLMTRVRELEREIKKLLQEKTDLNKGFYQREEEMKKLEGRLQHAQSDRTSLMARVASLEKDIKDVNKSNSVLKNKMTSSEESIKKKDDRLLQEVSDVKKQLEKKEKEIGDIKHDIDTAVTGLLKDLKETWDVTDRLNSKVSQLEQSFDDKDVDSTEEAKAAKSKLEKSNLDVFGKVNKARDETKKIKCSLEDLTSLTERKITNVKSKLREKYEGTVAKLQLLSEELQMKEENLDSSKTCTDALKKYGDALKHQNRGLMLIVSHLRQEQWQCEDTIRSLKGEMFALSDENKVYEQQTFESNAELATLLEKIEQGEEKEEMLNTNIRNLTEKYHVIEKALEEEQKQHRDEIEKLRVELQVTQHSLQQSQAECDNSQRTYKDLIHSLNTVQNNSDKLVIELEQTKSASDELWTLAESRFKEIAEKDQLLQETQGRIDGLSQEIALKSAQIDSLQSRLTQSDSSETTLRAQISDMTNSHKKTVEVYLERIEILQEEKTSLIEEKHSLLSRVDELMSEKNQLQLSLQSSEELLTELRLQHASDMTDRQKKISELEDKYHQTESEFCGKLEDLEHKLQSMSVKSETDLKLREQKIRELEMELADIKSQREATLTQLVSCKDNLAMVTEELNAAMNDVVKLAEEKESVVEEYKCQLSGVERECKEERSKLEVARQELSQQLEDSKQQSLHLQESLDRLANESTGREQNLESRLSDLRIEMEKEKVRLGEETKSLADKLAEEIELRSHVEENIVRVETEKETEVKEMSERLQDVRHQLTTAQSEIESTRAGLTAQLTATQNLNKNLEEQLTRLRDEKNYDVACSSERFATLEENARDQRKLFEELKEDFAARLKTAKAEKDTVSDSFQLYKVQTEADIEVLKCELKQSQLLLVKQGELQHQVDTLHKEKAKLNTDIEGLKLTSMTTLGEVQCRLAQSENEVAHLLSSKQEQDQLVTRLQKEKAMLSDERNRCVSEYNILARELEEMRETHQEHLEQQAQAADTDALHEEINKWRTLFEGLQEKVAPFMEQIDAFEAERLCLLGRSANAQAEINKLSMEYAKLLGHQNQKQKIKHIVKLKEENNDLKKETRTLREQVLKLKRQMERGGGTERQSLGETIRRKFDPTKAFQHSKENRGPAMSPLRDGNRK